MRIIRPLTADQRDKAQDRSQARYDRIFREVEAEARADLVYHGFDPATVVWHDIHREAQRRVELEQRHDAEEAADALL